MKTASQIAFADPPLAKLFFNDTRMGPVWLLIRCYVGWQWLAAGWEKLMSSTWVGQHAGVALQGFVSASLQKTAGPHPEVAFWYATFLQHTVLPNVAFFSYLITFGELAVGIALMLGIFTGIAAFFGAYMNMNYLFAGTISINPILFILELFLILGWKVAGWYGVDRWLLPYVGTPWQKGKAFS